jgi:hypothetical protein
MFCIFKEKINKVSISNIFINGGQICWLKILLHFCTTLYLFNAFYLSLNYR